MTKHIHLKVEQADIDQGVLDVNRLDAGRAQTCPIALSLKRRFPGEAVSVSPFGAQVGPRVYRLSSPARAFVGRADRDENVEPATFELTFLRDR